MRRTIRNLTCIASAEPAVAGRKGEAILFISAARGEHLLRGIERAMRQQIDLMKPSDRRRGERPADRQIQGQESSRRPRTRRASVTGRSWNSSRRRPTSPDRHRGASLRKPGAELATPTAAGGAAPRRTAAPLTAPRPDAPGRDVAAREGGRAPGEPGRGRAREHAPRADSPPRADAHPAAASAATSPEAAPRRTETFPHRGRSVHEIKAGNIVARSPTRRALDGVLYRAGDIREDHSFVGRPEGMPREIFKTLKKSALAGAN